MKRLFISLLFFISILGGLFTLSSCKTEEKITENDEKTQLYIKQEYLNFYLSDEPDFTVDDIKIDLFLGIYDNAYVARFTRRGILYSAGVWTEDIGGINFIHHDGNCILVYKNHRFYTLKYAYESNVLTIEHIKEIHNKFKNRYGG